MTHKILRPNQGEYSHTQKTPLIKCVNALFALKMYFRDNVIMSASAAGGAEVQTCHMALKTCQSSRVTPSICFSVHIVSNKCRHKTLPSTYQNVALVGWNYHVVFPPWEMTPFPLPNCSNYEKCTCVRLEVVGTWCVWLVLADLLKSRACMRSNADDLKHALLLVPRVTHWANLDCALERTLDFQSLGLELSVG